MAVRPASSTSAITTRPAGMPVSIARKIEHILRREGHDLDILLDPLLLTAEQVEHFDLPRIPIKDSDQRKGQFEARHGTGAVELDALEAIHPASLPASSRRHRGLSRTDARDSAGDREQSRQIEMAHHSSSGGGSRAARPGSRKTPHRVCADAGDDPPASGRTSRSGSDYERPGAGARIDVKMLGCVTKEGELNEHHPCNDFACVLVGRKRGRAPRRVRGFGWFLTHVAGMKGTPVRESSTEQRRKQQWLAIRKEAGLKIDPESAEVFWNWGQVLDPYGIWDLTDEEKCIRARSLPAHRGAKCEFHFTTCRTQFVIAYGQGSMLATLMTLTMTCLGNGNEARRAKYRAAPDSCAVGKLRMVRGFH